MSIILISTIAENNFPKVFGGDEEKKINIEIELSDIRHRAIFIIVVFLILFTPVINWIISFGYGCWVIYMGYSNRGN
ncbi:hypothetical protein [Clostridium formicaceticum]|uniref:hypothetical protein n=1 Tax=Clostridium formicaceticum TaxID=1497 RepID=UPI0014725B8E|nr:hypothetical protein [Clostridium formicaceticum]